MVSRRPPLCTTPNRGIPSQAISLLLGDCSPATLVPHQGGEVLGKRRERIGMEEDRRHALVDVIRRALHELHVLPPSDPPDPDFQHRGPARRDRAPELRKGGGGLLLIARLRAEKGVGEGERNVEPPHLTWARNNVGNRLDPFPTIRQT